MLIFGRPRDIEKALVDELFAKGMRKLFDLPFFRLFRLPECT